MNKDKELEEAIYKLKHKNLYIQIKPSSVECIDCINNNRNKHIEAEIVINPYLDEAIETVLQALETKDKEIKKLYTIRNEVDYGYENTHIITQNRLATIERNKYLIEIEDGKFVDIKELYENSILKNKIKYYQENEYYNVYIKCPECGHENYLEIPKDLKKWEE